MKNVSKLGLLAFLIAAVAALAFTPQKNKVATTGVTKSADPNYLWIKYDCNNNEQVQIVESGTNYSEEAATLTNYLTECEGSYNVCARLYHVDYLEAAAGEGNLQPKQEFIDNFEAESYCVLPPQ